MRGEAAASGGSMLYIERIKTAVTEPHRRWHRRPLQSRCAAGRCWKGSVFG